MLEKMKLKQFREDLKQNLDSLPKPKNDYQIDIPEEILIAKEKQKQLELD